MFVHYGVKNNVYLEKRETITAITGFPTGLDRLRDQGYELNVRPGYKIRKHHCYLGKTITKIAEVLRNGKPIMILFDDTISKGLGGFPVWLSNDFYEENGFSKESPHVTTLLLKVTDYYYDRTSWIHLDAASGDASKSVITNNAAVRPKQPKKTNPAASSVRPNK